MSRKTFGDMVRDARMEKNLNQAQLAKKMGVSPAMISHWETGRFQVASAYLDRLSRVLGISVEYEISDNGTPFGNWLNKERNSKGMTAKQLAEKVSISTPAVYAIESGRIRNPRPNTVRRLEKALGKTLPAGIRREIKEEADAGIGELFDFDPYNPQDVPEFGGIYVLYDISERPIYVGKASSIASRIKAHEEKFWFKQPLVETAACIRVDDSEQRHKIEKLLIQFLKRNAVLNKQNVEREADED